jgi:hypothetical protein
MMLFIKNKNVFIEGLFPNKKSREIPAFLWLIGWLGARGRLFILILILNYSILLLPAGSFFLYLLFLSEP